MTVSRATPLRIAISGAGSSGKTTLCHGLVYALKKKSWLVTLVEERARAARARGFQLDEKASYAGQYFMTSSQASEELAAMELSGAEVIIHDRCIVDQVVYTTRLFEKQQLTQEQHDNIASLARNHTSQYPYDAVYLIRPLPDIQDDQVRDTSVANRDRIAEIFAQVFAEPWFAKRVVTIDHANGDVLDQVLADVADQLPKRPAPTSLRRFQRSPSPAATATLQRIQELCLRTTRTLNQYRVDDRVYGLEAQQTVLDDGSVTWATGPLGTQPQHAAAIRIRHDGTLVEAPDALRAVLEAP